MISLIHNISEMGSLSLKTKNLKIALKDLDLITDGELKDLNKTKKLQKTIFLSKILRSTKSNKRDYNDMNKFAKTLVGKDNWEFGTFRERGKFDNIKIPKKPEDIELKRELPINMLKHMPRKRLPPINNTIRFNTLTGFYTDRKKRTQNEINKENVDNLETK